MSPPRRTMPASPLNPSSTLDLLRARAVERCAACGTERARGTATTCRCATPRWQPFCARCARAFEGEVCPACLEVARANGVKLRAALDAACTRPGAGAAAGSAASRSSTPPPSPLDAAIAAHHLLRERAARVLANFGIAAQVAPLPAWAARLADSRAPLPPGTEHSRAKMAAVRDLRLEDAAVRVALEALGYNGLPSEEKLERLLAEADAAAAALAAWDGLSAGADADAILRRAADLLVANDAQADRLLETLTRRDLGRLLDAGERRARAVAACRTALGVA